MKKNHVKRRTTLDVSLPDTLHQDFVQDLTTLIDRLLSSQLSTVDNDSGKFKLRWLRENLLSKYLGVGPTTAVERKNSAITKWLKMESRNRDTNIRLRFMEADFGRFSSEQVFTVASRFITKMIGRSPDQVVFDCQFTNGASTRVKRGSTAIANKYTGKLHCSTEAWPVFLAYARHSPLWEKLIDDGICTPDFHESSELFTVPKSSLIDRVACKEPEINMFLQRGVGNYFRDQLRKNGCDLNDQTINRRLARRGSLQRGLRLATIDLSSASDLISTSLVYRLLPLEWVMYLESIRVKSTLIGGKIHELEMFSSMGNGFTFELESMIFLALARAVAYLTRTRGIISVYGDDIIIPCSLVGLFTKVLQFCGMKVNMTKSFSRGYFRESCGGHYFGGNDVTPFYIRKDITSLPDLILVLNQLRSWATHEDVALQFETTDFYNLWSTYSKFVPRFLYGGRETGSDFALLTPHYPRKRIKRVQRKHQAEQLGALIYWLHRRPDDGLLHFETSFGMSDGDYVVHRNRTWDAGLPLNQQWWEEIISPSTTR